MYYMCIYNKLYTQRNISTHKHLIWFNFSVFNRDGYLIYKFKWALDSEVSVCLGLDWMKQIYQEDMNLSTLLNFKEEMFKNYFIVSI